MHDRDDIQGSRLPLQAYSKLGLLGYSAVDWRLELPGQNMRQSIGALAHDALTKLLDSHLSILRGKIPQKSRSWHGKQCAKESCLSCTPHRPRDQTKAPLRGPSSGNAKETNCFALTLGQTAWRHFTDNPELVKTPELVLQWARRRSATEAALQAIHDV